MPDASPSAAARPTRRAAIAAFKALVLLALFAVAATKIDFARSLSLLAVVSPIALALAFAAKLTGLAAAVLRWAGLLRALGAKTTHAELVRLTCGGEALNLVLPSSMGGDVYRIVGVRREADGLVTSTALVAAERLYGFLATCLLALVAIVVTRFWEREPTIALSVLGFSLLVVAVGAATHRPRAARAMARLCLRLRFRKGAKTIRRVARSVGRFAYDARVVATAVFWSVVMKISVAGQYLALAWGLGVALDPASLAVFLPLHMVVSSLPVSIAGVGLREANTVVYFTHFGLTPESAAALALLVLAWVYVSGAPFALALWIAPRDRAGAPLSAGPFDRFVPSA